MRLLLLLLSLIYAPSAVAHIYLEKEYQNYWCRINGGQTEVRLQDATRIDCLTGKYAIEFDFASKWAEAIGQSLYYASCTGKKAGIVLIIEDEKRDLKYLRRIKNVTDRYNIQVWTIKPEDIQPVYNCGN